MARPLNIRVRGIRQTLPTGTLIGRTSGGKGPAQLIKVTDLAQAVAFSGGLPLPGPGATGPTGPTGATGATGPAGPVFNNAGTWSNNSAYSKGDVVQYNDVAYVCYSAVSAPGGTPVVWDGTDKLNETLTTTNRANDTATSGAGLSWVLGNQPKTTGKLYFEYQMGNLLDNNTAVGIGNVGAGANGGGTAIGAIGSLIVASGFGTGSFAGFSAGIHGAVAVDLSAQLFWITANVTGTISWNGSTLNLPATGTGGIAIGGTIMANPVCPLFTSPSSGSQSCIIFADLATLVTAPPAGFGVWQATSANNPTPEFDFSHWLSQTVRPHYIQAHSLLGGL